MAKHRIPSFITSLDKGTKETVMKEWLSVSRSHSIEHLTNYLQQEVDRLVREDEKGSFTTFFQTKWNRAKNLGKREVLRKIIKDLTGLEE